MIPKNGQLLSNAKKLRKEMTRQERHLWYDFLRSYPIKIYKQRIIGNYIVDFYCAAAKLVIELDGSQHFSEKGSSEDQVRDRFLKDHGLEVIRLSNSDIDQNFEGTCEFLDRRIRERQAHKTSPSRLRRATSP